MWFLFLKKGTNGVESTVYTNVVDGKVNPAFEAESPPQYNGVKAEVQVGFPLFITIDIFPNLIFFGKWQLAEEIFKQ